MVAGSWANQDGLYLQFGTQKTVPDLGGEYVVYGETREIEQLIPLVPMTIGAGGQTVAAPPTSFSGTSTAAAAGIQSLTTFLPLQTTAVNTGGTTIALTAPQIFIDQVEVTPLIGATGGTSISIGLVTTNPANGQFVQVTPNAGTQLIKAMLLTDIDTAGERVTYDQVGATTGLVISSSTRVAGGGDWLTGNMPLVTNAITPLPTQAWISTIATGTFTNGLLKLRIKFTTYGSINF